MRNEKFRSPVHSIIKKPSSEKQARFSVANVTKEPGGHVESSNVKFQEEVFIFKTLISTKSNLYIEIFTFYKKNSSQTTISY